MNIFKKQNANQSADGGAKCKTGDRPQFCVLRFAFCVDSGFTLVEVFISMAIFVAVMVAVGTFLSIYILITVQSPVPFKQPKMLK